MTRAANHYDEGEGEAEVSWKVPHYAISDFDSIAGYTAVTSEQIIRCAIMPIMGPRSRHIDAVRLISTLCSKSRFPAPPSNHHNPDAVDEKRVLSN
jgi:hypothetical protein